MLTWWNLDLSRLVLSPELAPMHRRIEAPERMNRDTRLLVLGQGLVERPSARMLWPEVDAAFVTGGGNGGPPAATRRPVVVIAASCCAVVFTILTGQYGPC